MLIVEHEGNRFSNSSHFDSISVHLAMHRDDAGSDSSAGGRL
jgi:hypothetical protein